MAKMRTTRGDVVDVRVSDLVGRKAWLRVAMRTGAAKYPLSAPVCKCCGVSVYIRRVDQNDVLLAPELDAR